MDPPRRPPGNPAAFRWAVIGESSPVFTRRYDLVPDAANGLPDEDPRQGSLGKRDDWFCSLADDGLSAGYATNMANGTSSTPWPGRRSRA